MIFAFQALVICYICGVRIKTDLDRKVALEAEREARLQLETTSQRNQRSEERYRGMVAAVPQVVFVTDPEFELQWLNDRWAGLTGLSDSMADRFGLD